MGPWKARLAPMAIREGWGGRGLGRNCFLIAAVPGGKLILEKSSNSFSYMCLGRSWKLVWDGSEKKHCRWPVGQGPS